MLLLVVSFVVVGGCHWENRRPPLPILNIFSTCQQLNDFHSFYICFMICTRLSAIPIIIRFESCEKDAIGKTGAVRTYTHNWVLVSLSLLFPSLSSPILSFGNSLSLSPLVPPPSHTSRSLTHCVSLSTSHRFFRIPSHALWLECSRILSQCSLVQLSRSMSCTHACIGAYMKILVRPPFELHSSSISTLT